MSRGVATALTLLRVPRGAPAPGDAEMRAALERDRAGLNLPAEGFAREVVSAGPYAVSVDGGDYDEYVIWER